MSVYVGRRVCCAEYEHLSSFGHFLSVEKSKKINKIRNFLSFFSVLLMQDDAGSAVLYGTPSGYYELIGVLSDQQSCHQASLPNEPPDTYDYYLPMFTKIQSHIDWILYQTKDACYCNKI